LNRRARYLATTDRSTPHDSPTATTTSNAYWPAWASSRKTVTPATPKPKAKSERFHQTLKRWLTPRPHPTDLNHLQALLDTFRTHYNTARPHRALPEHRTPAQAYTALPKAAPANAPTTHFRIRHDSVDQFGKLTLRHRSRLHHLGIGRTHAHTPVLILVTAATVTVISKNHHRVLSSHHIDPDRNYWRNQTNIPGRWPGKSVTDDATHL
jgi:Integrase core domain